MANDPAERFGFGKNWKRFVETKLNAERIESAQRQMLESLRLADLKGMAFLDIGCGSGLHSLAAYRAGAKQILSFDYDPDSVRTTNYLRSTAGSPANWTVMQGSVLDAEFMGKLPEADLVYSWGVLHHTGDVWQAIRNAAGRLAPGGTFFIALYSSTCYENAAIYGNPLPEKWLRIKQRYNRSSALGKWGMERAYVLTSGFARPLWNLPAAFRAGLGALRDAKKYHRSRGMDYWTDVRDWLGGWPMEFVDEQDCLDFCREELGLECLRILTGEGNTEYLFRRLGADNYWTPVLNRRQTHRLSGPFTSAKGYAWRCALPSAPFFQASASDSQRRFSLMLSEDARPLGSARSPRAAIERYGRGRYDYDDTGFYFSTPDHSDPNTNGRGYFLSWLPENP